MEMPSFCCLREDRTRKRHQRPIRWMIDRSNAYDMFRHGAGVISFKMAYELVLCCAGPND
jgi:hypothetical protein